MHILEWLIAGLELLDLINDKVLRRVPAWLFVVLFVVLIVGPTVYAVMSWL